MPVAGGAQRLLRFAGRCKVMLWCPTGEMIPVADACAANLASKLVSAGRTLPNALVIARQMAAMPPLAAAAIRDAMRLGADAPLDAVLGLERRHFERLFDSQDKKEGMQALLEKRAPKCACRRALRRAAEAAALVASTRSLLAKTGQRQGTARTNHHDSEQ